ncbi:hypothetical protein Brsp01_14520 [Brucella sp. NBRC 12950]|nr:hypothetical protein Brsp01_14520 [Brucella sp. NBRC 12950]
MILAKGSAQAVLKMLQAIGAPAQIPVEAGYKAIKIASTAPPGAFVGNSEYENGETFFHSAYSAWHLIIRACREG